MKSKGLLALGAILSTASSPARAEGQPHIIVFLVDDLGLMDTSVPFLTDSEGRAVRHPLNERYRTPNMARLAERGTRFSTFYAQSVSSPSRTSLMTGLNAARHRTTNWIHPTRNNRDTFGPPSWRWQGISQTDLTLASLLSTQGYKTIHVGKAHFGPSGSWAEDPRHIGFEVSIAGSSIGEPGSYLGRHGYGLFRGHRPYAVPGFERYHGTDTFLTDALTLEAMAEMDRALDERRPIFLHLSHYAVHSPFEADPRFAEHYQDTGQGAAANAFATLVEGMDRSLGEILDYLERKGIASNTLIVFLGDNGSDAPLGATRGYSSSSPLRGKKGTEFEGGMRAPLLVAWAKSDEHNIHQRRLPIGRGAIRTQLTTIMDLFPTLATLGGVRGEGLPPSDGQSLARLLSQGVDPTREEVWLMHFPHSHRGSYFTVYREGEWKLIYYYNPEHPERPDCVLYHLASDPEERQDLSKSHPKELRYLLTRMVGRLDAQRACYPVDIDGREIRPSIEYFFPTPPSSQSSPR